MKEKLISILNDRRDEKGFTLIELLVVIAIIAILVVIVVVAINPAERLREAADRAAASNARASGTLISVCVTRTSGDLDACNTEALVEGAAGGDGNLAETVTFAVEPALPAATAEICVWELGRAGQWFVYRQSTGQVEQQAALPVLCT